MQDQFGKHLDSHPKADLDRGQFLGSHYGRRFLRQSSSRLVWRHALKQGNLLQEVC